MATTTRALSAPHTRPRWLYADMPLIAFVIVMVAAAAITSHGTYVFYSYILSSFLAYSATVVLTAGIPLLELAAVLDKANRPRYIAGMLVLLAMEGMAQYFQGQAIFVRAVKTQFPDAAGIDLATFAAQPWGRVLPLLYLAALSGIVVYFGYAASARIRDLRAGATQATQQSDQVAHLHAKLTQAEQDRDTLASLATQHDTESAHLAQQLARSEVEARQTVAQMEEQVNQRDTRIAELTQRLTQVTHQPPVDDTLMVGGKHTVSWRQLEELTGVSQTTLRRKITTSTNGHLTEA